MDIINRMNEYYPSQEDGNGTNGLALGRLGRNVNIDIMLNPQQQLAAGGAGDQQMNAIFQMCKNNQWDNVLNSLKSNPDYITRSMSMTNNIETSVLHQAITSKGSLPARVKVIDYILDVAPTAAQKKNGYQSLPLHVICQRNTKMSSKTKERLIVKLIEKYPQGLNEAGGVGQRTPIHIVFTDYVSLGLTALMIDTSKNVAESVQASACFIKDKHGNLPHHVACSRHVSPGKLEKLLEVNHGALIAKNNQKATLLRLATSTATKSHPNNALIKYLKERMKEIGHDVQFAESHCGSPAPGIKPPPPGGYGHIKKSDSKIIPVQAKRCMDPSPGPLRTLTAAVSYAAAASPGYAAHIGQIHQMKVKREDGQNPTTRRHPRRSKRSVQAYFAVQQLNNQHHNSFNFLSEPQMCGQSSFLAPQKNQDPGDANLLLQFARGGLETEDGIESVEV